MGIEKRVYSFRFDPEMVARLQLRAEDENWYLICSFLSVQ